MIDRILICGKGSTGIAWGDLCTDHKIDVQYYDPKKNEDPPNTMFDCIHLMFPCIDANQYLTACQQILKRFASPIIIVNSTIVLGILPELVKNYPHLAFYYSPMRAREADMPAETKMLKRFIAAINNLDIGNGQILDYMKRLNLELEWFKDAEALVMGKLAEVSWFGMNIAFCQMMKLICDKYHLNFEEAYTQYTEGSRIGKDYRKTPLEYMQRPIFVPNKIGGKCVIQDIELMQKTNCGHSNFFWWIIDQNNNFGEKP